MAVRVQPTLRKANVPPYVGCYEVYGSWRGLPSVKGDSANLVVPGRINNFSTPFVGRRCTCIIIGFRRRPNPFLVLGLRIERPRSGFYSAIENGDEKETRANILDYPCSSVRLENQRGSAGHTRPMSLCPTALRQWFSERISSD